VPAAEVIGALPIRMLIRRDDAVVFQGQAGTARLRRSLEDIVHIEMGPLCMLGNPLQPVGEADRPLEPPAEGPRTKIRSKLPLDGGSRRSHHLLAGRSRAATRQPLV
jgi:hypothetical protein